MADLQNPLEDLIGKLGFSLGDSESRRQDMIRRLKTVKDPIERDQIIWALSGQKKEEPGYRPPSRKQSYGGVFGKQPKAQTRPAPVSVSQGAPTMSPGPSPRASATQPMRLGNILNYIVPVLFLFFGVTNIGRAIEAFRAGAQKEEIFIQLLIGIGFIVFALAGFFSSKMKKSLEKAKGR
jgi:hypothetical protein